MAIIYKLTNTIDDKIYIGSSTNDVPKYRLSSHKSNKNCGCAEHFNNIGWNNVSLEVIEECEEEVQKIREQIHLDKYFETPICLNKIRAYTGIVMKHQSTEEGYAHEYSQKYYDMFKEEVKSTVKKYAESEQGRETRHKRDNKNRDKLNKQKREWAKIPENHEKKLKINAEYRQQNKEVLSNKLKEKVICDHCGALSTKRNIAQHKKSKKCLGYNK